MSTYQRGPTPVTIHGLWLVTFSATFAGALLAGVLLLLGVRFYLQWSIKDTMQKANQEFNALQEKERKAR